MRFTPPANIQLQDEAAERVRLNHERILTELRDSVRRLDRPSFEWQLVERKTPLTATTQQVGFSNLRGNSDRVYRLRCWIKDVNANLGPFELRINGGAGTRSQRLRGTGTTASATVHTNLIYIGGAGQTTSDLVVVEGTLYAATGSVRAWLGRCGIYDNTTPEITSEIWDGYWNDTTTEITELAVKSQQPNGIGVGSWFELYRKADL